MNSKTERTRPIHLLVRGLLGVSLACLAATGRTWAQEDANSTQAPPAVGVDGKATLIAFPKDCTIRQGLQILAALYGKNIVPASKVDGVLGFTRLRDVTFEEAMDAILGTAFMYEATGPILKVYTKAEYKQITDDQKKARAEAEKVADAAELKRREDLADPARMVCRVFTVYYTSATEIKKLVQPVLSKTGSVEASSQASNTLPTGQSITSGSGGGDTMALNDTLVVKDFPEQMEVVSELIRQLDVRPKQVLVEATILSCALNDETKFGVSLTYDDRAFNIGNTVVGTGAAGLSLNLLATDHISADIDALDKVSDTTLLANPKILAVNKQLGQVYIGQKIGYREGTTVGVGGVATEGTVKFLDTGTKLSFRPYIGNDGYIRMDIQPKDSTGKLVDDLQGKIPEETATELATNIMVKDGQTVVIGGLFRDTVIKDKLGVPLLADLPLVGPIFRSTTDSVRREEVIVMLTPHILDEPDHAAGEFAKADVGRKEVAAKESLEVFSRSRIAETRYARAMEAYAKGDLPGAMGHLKSALKLRPTYLEALRLKERILSQSDPEQYQHLQRILQDEMDWEHEAAAKDKNKE